MISKTRARRRLSEIMNKHRVRFTNDCITEMVEAIFGEDAADGLTDKGLVAARSYKKFLGYPPTTDMIPVLNALGEFSEADIGEAFSEVSKQKWYIENGKMPKPEALIQHLKQKENKNAGNNGQDKTFGEFEKRIMASGAKQSGANV